MKHNTPKDLKKLFDEMGEDVTMSHHLSEKYLKEIVEVICGITETCESKHETSTKEWQGFKCLRNGLRDLIK